MPSLVEAGCTPAQLSLVWLLARAPHIVPIPGTTSAAHLEENVHASGLAPSVELLARLGMLLNARTISGSRYNAAVLAEVDTEEPPT